MNLNFGSDSFLETPYFSSHQHSPDKSRKKRSFLKEFSHFFSKNLAGILLDPDSSNCLECYRTIDQLMFNSNEKRKIKAMSESTENQQLQEEKSEFQVSHDSELPINKFISCAFQTDIEKSPESLRNSLVYPKFLEFALFLLYEELKQKKENPEICSIELGEEEKTNQNLAGLKDKKHCKIRFFTTISETILYSKSNVRCLANRKLFENLLKALCLEKDPVIQILLQKIITKIAFLFPSPRILNLLFSSLNTNSSEFALVLLRDLATLRKIKPGPIRSLFFSEKTSGVCLETLTGMKSSESIAFYFEVKAYSMSNGRLLSMSSKQKGSVFSIELMRKERAFSLTLGFFGSGINERLGFAPTFEENAWIHLLISIEKNVIQLIVLGSQPEIVRFPLKGFFKSFEKPFLMILGSDPHEEFLGFQGELRAFFLINRQIRSYKDMLDFPEDDAFISINDFAGVCRESAQETQSDHKCLIFQRSPESIADPTTLKLVEKTGILAQEKRELEVNPGYYRAKKAAVSAKKENKGNVFLMRFLWQGISSDQKKPKRKPILSVRPNGVTVIEEIDFLQSFLGIQGFKRLFALIDSMSDWPDKQNAKRGFASLLEVIKTLTFFNETKEFFSHISPEILIIALRRFVKKQGFPRESLDTYFGLYSYFYEKFGISMFNAFLMNPSVFEGQEFEIQTSFLQRIKIELEKNTLLLSSLRENCDNLYRIFLSFELYSSTKHSLKSLEFETYRDFFLDILYVFLRDLEPQNSRSLIEVLKGINSGNSMFLRDYFDLLRRVEQNWVRITDMEKESERTKSEDSSYMDKSLGGNILILERFTPKQQETVKKSEVLAQKLEFEDFLLSLSLKTEFPIETLDLFLDVFIETRRFSSGFVREGSIIKLVEDSERDMDKIAVFSKVQGEFPAKFIRKMISVLREIHSLGVAVEESLLKAILKKINIENINSLILEDFSMVFKDFPALRVFFFAGKKKTELLIKFLNLTNEVSPEKTTMFLREILESAMKNRKSLGSSLEFLINYDNSKFLSNFRDSISDILMKKAQNGTFRENLTDILRILVIGMKEKPGLFAITDRTYIFAWKLFAEIENFPLMEKKTAYLREFLEISLETLMKSTKLSDFMQAYQILHKLMLQYSEILRSSREIREKTAIIHVFLLLKPEFLSPEFVEINKLVLKNLQELMISAFGKDSILAILKDRGMEIVGKDREITEIVSMQGIMEIIKGFFTVKLQEKLKEPMRERSWTKTEDSERRKPKKERKAAFLEYLSRGYSERQEEFLRNLKSFQAREFAKLGSLIRKQAKLIKNLGKTINYENDEKRPIFKMVKYLDPLARKPFIFPISSGHSPKEYLSSQKFQTITNAAKNSEFFDFPESFSQKSNFPGFSLEKPETLSEIPGKLEISMASPKEDELRVFLAKKPLYSNSSPERSMLSSGLLERADTVRSQEIKFQSQQLIICNSPEKKTGSCDSPFSDLVSKLRPKKKSLVSSVKNSRFLPVNHNSKDSEKTEMKEESKMSLDSKSGDQKTQDNRKDVYTFYAEKVSLKGSVWGKLTINAQGISFASCDEARPQIKPYIFGSLEESLIRDSYQKNWSYNKIEEIQPRNFNSLRNSFELFLNKGKSFFFVVHSPEYLVQVFDAIEVHIKNRGIVLIKEPEKYIKKSKLQEKWANGEMTNFEYLMKINFLAGRTYHDLNQYPVFPWTFVDFTGKVADISNPELYRDLSKPMGALEPTRLCYLRERYQELLSDNSLPEDQKMKPFLYGSHYSSAGHIMHYLLRLEPITSLCLNLQSGRFDCPDRLFIEIAETWHSCLYFHSDFKELIPEFYYHSEFLRNRNRYEFGKTQNGVEVSEVILPKWARSPEEYVFRNRQALEGRIASKGLAAWIDLIFGFKQNGEEAKKADNLFYYMTYEGQTDLINITDDKELKASLTQLASYGQTPRQIFKTKHPERVFREDNSVFLEKNVHKYDKLRDFEVFSKGNSVDFDTVWSFQQEIISIGISESGLRIVLDDFSIYFLPFIHQMTLIPCTDWDKSGLKKKQHTLEFEEEFEDAPVIYQFKSPELSHLIVISGFSDNSFHIYKNNKIISEEIMIFHKKPISAMTCYEKKGILFCGSKDCRISIWELDFENWTLKAGPLKKPKNVLYGHEDEIISLDYDEDTGVLLSIDRGGMALIFSLRLRRLMKKLTIGGDKLVMGIIHNYGIIAAFSKENSYVYSLNGDIVERKKMDKNKGLKQVSWLGKNSSEIVMAFDNGELEIYDVFGFESKRLFILPLLGQKKRIKFFRIYESKL